MIERDTANAVRRCRCLFLDSGAHSLYTEQVILKKHKEGYTWYESPAFWKYCDRYAKFIKKYRSGMDYYANVDVIFNPELTWKAQRYLEDKHGLQPVPVIHYGTDLKWLERYLRAGYKLLGIGGLGQEATRNDYKVWADDLFDRLCNGPDRLPCVRTHGFAMTSFGLMTRYPWWSVDSASWAKAAGFGMIFVPHRRAGKFTFLEHPYAIGFSHSSNFRGKEGKHYLTLKPNEQEVVRDWLSTIDVPLGKGKGRKEKNQGVLNHYGTRAVANLRYFERLCESLPPYPWPFRIKPRKGFF